VASHELRTPITGIRWAAESLEHFETDERLHKLAHAIYDSALTLQASTDDILELTAVTKSQKMEMSTTNLTELLSGVINTQQLTTAQKGVSFVWDPSWPPEIMVKCDATKMKRAMHNVISNAIKYTRSNTTITLSYASTDKEHILNVTDQGIGIPASEQAKVFAGFYRASNAKESDIKGTGLGLYLVKAVVEKHRGHVSFISEENKGTTFTIILPK
jgi:signal transduction histidine kinase